MVEKPRFGETRVSFDHYYFLLQEFVASPDAWKRVAEYHAAKEQYRLAAKTGDPVENDEATYNAFTNLRGVAYGILEAHGYKDYLEVARTSEPGSTGFRPMNMLAFIGDMFIGGKTRWPLDERSIDISSPDDVEAVLRACANIESFRNLIPVELD